MKKKIPTIQKSSAVVINLFLDSAGKFLRGFSRSEGAAEGGCGGNSATPERSAGAKWRRSDFPSKNVRAKFRISHKIKEQSDYNFVGH